MFRQPSMLIAPPLHRLRRAWACVALAGALAMAGGGDSPAPRTGEPSLEYQVKAAFLVKLGLFVEWPATAFSTPETPVCIGLLGDDPFGQAFDEAAGRERVNGRPVRVHRARTLAELDDCQIIFISASESGRMAELTRALTGRPVLTVGDHPTFAREGGAVNFFKEDGRVRFEVNRAATERAGLRLSSKLLQVARIHDPAKGGKS